ncbi:MAG: hypothetical protein M3Z01_05590, partial [Thermoproteota archaeon]|nr:hypothetical protein [Thermoproteota archaeon]
MRFNDSKLNKDKNIDSKEKDDRSCIYNSSSGPDISESYINNLSVVGVIKVDEHSRLTFSKRIKSVFPILPGDTIVVYHDLSNSDLLFKVQHYNEAPNIWIIKRKNNDILLPSFESNTLKKISTPTNVDSNDNNDENKKQQQQQQQQSKYQYNIMIVDDDPDTAEALKSLILDFNNEGDGRQYNIDT